MIRSWGLITLTGTAQPCFGDLTTAAVNTAPLGGNGIIPVTVASTTRYRVGDRIYVEPGTANQDMLMIDTIPSATVLNCRSEAGAKTHAHATGAILQLSVPTANMNIQPLAAQTNPVFLGADATVTSVPGGSVYQEIVPSSPPSTQFSIGYNIMRTSDVWMVGTAGDKVIVSAMVA